MDELPDELIELIFESCDFKSYKSLRLTCKNLARVVVPRIYEHVHCGLFPKNLERLRNISTHPELRHMVRRFTFHGELLPHYNTKKEWERQIDLRPSFKSFFDVYCKKAGLSDEIMALPGYWEENREYRRAALEVYEGIPRYRHTKDELTACWDNYQKYRMEQDVWGPLSSRMFSNALARLPNLRDAAMVTGRFGEVKKHGPVWGELLREILQGPEDWKYIPAREHDNLRVHSQLEGVRQLTDLLEALCNRKSSNPSEHVQSLEFFTGNEVFWIQRSDGEVIVPHCYTREELLASSNGAYPRIYAMRGAFEHLKKLDLTICFLIFEDDVESITEGMKTFLREARVLEELRFEWSEENLIGLVTNEPLCDPLEDLEDVYWPRLRSLHLSFTTKERNLLALFKRHAATLRDLSLKDMFIAQAQGTWKNVIEQLPKVLKLETIYLEALWDYTWEGKGACLFEWYEGGAYELSIINYCLHGGPPPIIYPEEWNKLHPDDPAPTADLEDEDDEWDDEDEDDDDDDEGTSEESSQEESEWEDDDDD
ncbi:uncharacterized protein K452DRAFT_288744 [Aplosporella prunicola CBS 121167]|uniref:F-box domain-containing protein n=1 Tax=Aplosporella prunicola CBS 121167 TaxID=1176127 RepID=A0A6A6B9E3_9PEZI|nr:uncharacterized protein K452DRAFT_288744 [Aplosporella prunicola CBS 121167]KAF2140646.1 hypothetical protein K452DRAFT_288744 [Aplosporella prunicola CBS 121167]